MSKRKMMGILSLVFTIIVWGITFLATQALLDDFTEIEIMFYRFGLSYLALFLLLPKIFKWQGWKVELLCFLASILGMSIYQTLENLAISLANGSVVSIIIATASFFTCFFARFILKTKIKLSTYIGLIISMTGIIFVIISGNKLAIDPLGDVIAIICAILWGLYSVVVELVNKYKLNVVQVTRRITLDCMIVLIPIFIFSGSKFGFNRFLNIENTLWTLFLGILASAVCFCTWNYSVDVLGSVVTSLAFIVQPLVTIIIGVLFFNNNFTWIGYIGIILTVLGLYISLSMEKKKKEVEPQYD